MEKIKIKVDSEKRDKKNPPKRKGEKFKLEKGNKSPKGQLISKPIYDLLTSPKKRTDEFDLFAFLLFTANKSNQIRSFFGRS